MTFMEKLRAAWTKNNSLVCVGLDPDISKIPECLNGVKNSVFEFNKAIVDATAPYACTYKPQAAYYAGADIDAQLSMTIDYIHEKYPLIPVILDTKRGDIGSTSEMYVKEAFGRYKADAVTVNPYMGSDALKPFLDCADKGIVILGRTSNPGGQDIQNLKVEGREIYKIVAGYASEKWNYNKNVLLVVGATCPEELAEVRKICPDMPFLVPGVGAQGGDVKKVLENGRTKDGTGLVINSSRGIIYASKGSDFAEAAGKACAELRDTINLYR